MTIISIKHGGTEWSSFVINYPIEIRDPDEVVFVSTKNNERLRVTEYDGGFRIEYAQREIGPKNVQVLNLKFGQIERVEPL
jgi:hypothetical protein